MRQGAHTLLTSAATFRYDGVGPYVTGARPAPVADAARPATLALVIAGAMIGLGAFAALASLGVI